MKYRSCKIYSKLSGTVKKSIRTIAELTGISKSSVHRHSQTIQNRNIYPESCLWETEEGVRWLCRLYFGSILFFVVHCGIGAEKMSIFFKFLRLDIRIGTSPAEIKKIAKRGCALLADYQQEQEEHHKPDKPLKIIGGVDETYFKSMILVLMDLSSGYIFVEEESEDKSYETWLEKVKKIADKFGIEFKYFVSDRAKQLIKLATQGFNSSSIPDLFHASHELVKLFGLNLNRQKANIQKKIAKEIVKLALLKKLYQDIYTQEAIIDELEIQQLEIEKGISAYHDILHQLSILMHPFDIKDSAKMTSAMVAVLLYEIEQKAQNLKEKHNISNKKDHLKKFKKQIEEMASLIDTWWLWVDEYLLDEATDENLNVWIKQYLLPFLYWQKQASKTKAAELREAYQYAADKAQAALDNHPLTMIFIANEEIVSWAKWMISNFQRTSSAVEGRNGWLSQMHHNGRGILPDRLKAQTVFHNYYIQRDDGTTAAERLFRKKFTNPLEWVIERMGDLPLPRQSNKKLAVTC